MKPVNHTISSFKESVFSTITRLANEHRAINLSQGFPDFDGPQWVIELARGALAQGHLGKNQYAPSLGILPLREAIAKNYRRFYGLNYDPASEIIVTNGATEAIYSTIAALLNPGDEVVVFEPLYDSYLASLKVAQAVVKSVPLKAPDFTFDFEALKKQVSAKTKLLILNSPHNPTGKVFNPDELRQIARLAVEFDFYILSDEVYEFLTFDVPHQPIAALPGLRDRVITISSIGKTFSLTGWKVGWACGPKALIGAIHNIHQFISFCVAHPLQQAAAEALHRLDEYLVEFRAEYRGRRDLLVGGLKSLGYEVYVPAGTYFAIVKVPAGESDLQMCQRLIVDKKVATIPTSVFYLESDEGSSLIRVCFAKREETLKAALKNLGGGGDVA